MKGATYPGLDKCETAEELNDELTEKLNLSWFSIQVEKIEFLIVEEYRNSIYQNSYIMEDELEQVIKDKEDVSVPLWGVGILNPMAGTYWYDAF